MAVAAYDEIISIWPATEINCVYVKESHCYRADK